MLNQEIDEVILLAEGQSDHHDRYKRKVNSDDALLWPNGVVYYRFRNNLSKS